MKLAKVITLNDKVQVIVKKVVDSGKHSFTFNFVAMQEDASLVNTTLTLGYNSQRARDKDFDNAKKSDLMRLGKTLPTFKELLNEKAEG